MKKYIKLYTIFLKNSFVKEFSDVLNITMSHFAVIAWMLSVIIFYRVLFSHLGLIAGWNWAEILILIGTYFTIDGLIYTLFYWNMLKIKNFVENRNLDNVLTKPVSSQFVMSTQEIQASMYIQFVTTVIFIIIGVSKLGFSISFVQVLLYIVLVVCAAILAYSLWFIFTCLIFWIPNIDNIIHFFEEIFSFAQYPANIFSGVLKILIHFVIPLALMTTIPSQILTKKVETKYVILTFILTIVFFILTKIIWRLGIKKYTSN